MQQRTSTLLKLLSFEPSRVHQSIVASSISQFGDDGDRFLTFPLEILAIIKTSGHQEAELQLIFFAFHPLNQSSTLNKATIFLFKQVHSWWFATSTMSQPWPKEKEERWAVTWVRSQGSVKTHWGVASLVFARISRERVLLFSQNQTFWLLSFYRRIKCFSFPCFNWQWRSLHTDQVMDIFKGHSELKSFSDLIAATKSHCEEISQSVACARCRWY